MTASIVSDVTQWLDDVSSNWWFLVIIFAIALFDSVIPVVPSETTVILGGVAAGQGDQSLLLVIAFGAAGAFCGDNLAYLLGRRFKGRVARWATRKPSRIERLNAAAQQIRKRGGLLLITARFIPGGRTVLTVSSGITEQPHRWFAGWVALAGLIWATYAASLGALFGRTFKDNHTLAFALAFVAALSVTGLIELIRWWRSRNAAR